MSDDGRSLLETLGAQAAEEREEIARGAETEAAALLAAAAALSEAERGEALADLGRELAEREEKERGEEAGAKAARSLAARSELLEETFAGAAKKLGEEGDSYASSLKALILAAAEALAQAYPDKSKKGEALGRLKVRAKDRELAAEVLGGAGLQGLIALAEEEEGQALGPGGVLLSSLDGHLLLDNGYASRLERARAHCSAELAALLFGGAGA